MTTPSRDLGPLDRLAERAETLAGAWAARARASTTVGRERALLRMFGVAGLDAANRPLAWAAVDRYIGGGRGRLAGGIVLPFAMGLVEYDIDPQQLALDIASGAIDLGLEAELLREPERRALAEEEARRVAAAATDRIDANRTARRELIGLLGESARPWIGATISDQEIAGALLSADHIVRAGAELVQIQVPIGRELAERMRDAGLDAPVWEPGDETSVALDGMVELMPTGSQRALAILRRHLDELAAERRHYVRVAAIPPPLGAPESAVVAAFERIDIVLSDPLAEIVGGRVAPDRALADHAFAHGLLARAGVVVALSAGPLVVAPDLARGLPSDPATRAGRALAIQLVSVAIARGNGVPSDQLLVGALPAWLIGERASIVQAAGEVALRRALLPELSLMFEEPTMDDRTSAASWAAIVAAVAPAGPATGAILRRPMPNAAPGLAASRAAAAVTAGLASSFDERILAGPAAEHARATSTAALATLDRLANEGWESILGEGPGRRDSGGFGVDAIAERTETFDPFLASSDAR
jgi:beta-lysine 5,6-aminomutase alpha subunit